MGPECPHCQVFYEWTEGEILEEVYTPKTYFCQYCHELFTLTAEQVTVVQLRYREAVAEPIAWDEGLHDD